MPVFPVGGAVCGKVGGCKETGWTETGRKATRGRATGS